MFTIRKIMTLLLVLIVAVIVFPIEAHAAELGIEDGVYHVPVALWHEKNAKLSMGAKGLQDVAEVVVNNGQAEIYLAAQITDTNGISTSLMHFYYQEGGRYLRAESADWQLVLPAMQAGRPSIFIMPLTEKAEFYPVLVDPQVIFMGGTPIPARLKVEWSQLEKAAASELQARANAAPAPNVQGAVWLSVSGLEARIANEHLTQMPDLSAGNVLPDEMNKIKSAAGVSKGNAWKLSLNAPLLEVASGDIYDIEKIRTPLANVPMTVYFPKSANETTASLYAFAADGSKKDYPVVEDGGRWRADGVVSATLLLVEGDGRTAALAKKTTSATSQKPTASAGNTNTATRRAAGANSVTPAARATNAKPSQVTPNVSLNGEPLNSSTITPENSDGEKKESKSAAKKKQLIARENKGVIATVFAIFCALIATGIAIWRKNYPLFSDEMERYRYLQVFERKVLK